jgi:putative sigma-54 modulation protein
MQVQVHYNGLDNSPWMNDFITQRVAKLERYLNPSASIQVHLKFENRKYVTSLAIHNISHDYAYSCEGQNLYESFSLATDKAARALAEHKRKIKDKINRKFFSIKQMAA